MLNDAFFSVVSKDCARDELLVRARRPGDIEKIFTRSKVEKTPYGDYLFRAIVKRDEIARALAGEVARITYSNFKDSVNDRTDRDLHNAYLGVWTRMSTIQPSPPYGPNGLGYFFNEKPPIRFLKKKRARKLRGKGR